jgi:hypothetical protein
MDAILLFEVRKPRFNAYPYQQRGDGDIDVLFGGTMKPTLRYHGEAFRLLEERPVLSTTAMRLIEDWEQRHQCTMPKSVREWYSLQGADTRLTDPDLEYYQDPLAKLLDPADEHYWATHWSKTWSRPDLLPCLFVLGIRGEVHFSVRLQGDADPGMFDDVDPDRMDQTFSEFLLGIVEELVAQRE